jgi:hypothetical protein
LLLQVLPMTTATLDPSVPLRQDASVMGLVGLAHASSHFSHLLLPIMFPVFMKEFGWSFSELGLLSTVFFVVSGVRPRRVLWWTVLARAPSSGPRWCC